MRTAFNPRRESGARSVSTTAARTGSSMPQRLPPTPPVLAQENSPSSDRLRQLIEKNRAKQLARARVAEKNVKQDPHPAAEKLIAKKEVKNSSRPPVVVAAPALAFKDQQFKTKVLNPGNSFSSLTKKVSKAVKKRKKRNWKDYLVIIAWPIYLFLLGRLVFSQGGVMEYYQRQRELAGKEQEIASIEQENLDLEREITLIKDDKKYQRQIIRDHLGHIASDEYLILFEKGPREQKGKSI